MSLPLQLCRQVWLGLYDNKSYNEPDSKDENKIKDFMCQKYEKKRWYVAPTESMYQEAKKRNTPVKQSDTKPLRTLVGPNIPSLVVQNNQVSIFLQQLLGIQ
jgi:Arf-GAP domain and FG repeat-containing protein 1